MPAQRGREAGREERRERVAETLERPPADMALLSRVRSGDSSAYEELYRRHVEAVRRYAWSCCRDADTAEDLTNEVFARLLYTVRRGAGPDAAVRAHLLAAVRRVAAAWSSTDRRERLVEDFAAFVASADGAPAGGVREPDTVVRAMREAEQSEMVRAFRGLPGRWQTVLWHTVVESESPRETAPLLGLTTNAAELLTQRARNGLRQARLRAHTARSVVAGGDCAHHADRFDAYVRDGLRARVERGLAAHLERCARCRTAAEDVAHPDSRLRTLLPLAVMGWFPAAGSFGAAAAADTADGTAARGSAGSGTAALGASGNSGASEEPTATSGSEASSDPEASGTSEAPAASSASETFEVFTASGASEASAASSASETSETSGEPVPPGGVFVDGLAARTRKGVVASAVAAAAAAALMLILVGDIQGPSTPEVGARPSAPATVPSSEPGRERTEEVAEQRHGGAAAREYPADGSSLAPGSTGIGTGASGSVPEGAHGTAPAPPSATGSPRTSGPAPAPTSSGDRGRAPQGTPPADPPASSAPPPSVPLVYELGRLPRGVLDGYDGPVIRMDRSSWLWQRPGPHIGGRRYGGGLTVGTPSSVTVDLGRACTSYDALAGVDDLTVGGGAVRFSVYGDGVRLWLSDLVRNGSEPVPVHVPLAGVDTVRLVVEPHTVLDSVALADWAEARLTCR